MSDDLRKIDALVAEHVMHETLANFTPEDIVAGVTVGEMSPDGRYVWTCRDGGRDYYPLPHYSSDIAAAWEVFESISSGGTCEKWILRSDSPTTSHWTCTIDEDEERIVYSAHTAPLAICLAALTYKGVEMPTTDSVRTDR